MSSRRTPKPRPAIQAMTWNLCRPAGAPAALQLAKVLNACHLVTRSAVIFGQLGFDDDMLISSGTMKSGAWSKPRIRSARLVLR